MNGISLIGKESKMTKEQKKDYCSSCGKEMEGGIWTNGDGFGDAKYVDIEVGKFKGYCWDCYREGKAPNFAKQIDKAFTDKGMCGFLEAFIGRCRNSKPCAKHSEQKCWKCGKPAIRNCSATSSLVCGVPECAEHRHHK